MRLRDDFRRLWDTGFIDDLLLDVREGRAGKVVTFVVRERKRIQVVDYRGAKSLTTSAIEDALKEKEAALRLDSFYDPAKARRVEAIVKGMLAEKGRPFATVRHDAKSIGPAGPAGLVRGGRRAAREGQARGLRRQRGVLRRGPCAGA